LEVTVAQPPITEKRRTSKRILIVGTAVFLVLTAADGFVYLWQRNLVVAESNQTVSLSAQLAKTKVDIFTMTNLNNGTVPPAAKSMLPANQVGLVSDKIIFTLPSEWMKAAPTDGSPICVPGTIEAKPMICDDIISVLPSGQTPNASHPGYDSFQFQVDISAFQYSDGKSAKDWISDDYGEGLATMGDPSAIDQSNAPINGYDAFTYTSRYSDGSPPSTIFYAIIHGSYAVVVRATYTRLVNPTGALGNNVTVDYSKYLPDIKTLVGSIKFL
jgi:hypothetical protein